MFCGESKVFLYSYIIDPFYLLVVNYCCYLVCLKLPECWASVYMCTPSPTCPPPLGGWWPAVAKKPKIFFPFLFQILCSMFGEGKVGIPKRLMYRSPSFCPALSTPLLCSPWSPEHLFSRTNRSFIIIFFNFATLALMFPGERKWRALSRE